MLFLNKPEFPFIVVCIAGALFTWPLVDIYYQLSPLGRLAYFFCIWGGLVLSYFFWARKVR